MWNKYVHTSIDFMKRGSKKQPSLSFYYYISRENCLNLRLF